MRFILLLCAALALLPAGASAQARSYDAAQLESLLAPVALQPDEVLWQVLAAAVAPPAVAARILAPYPELHARMVESPQWKHDLGNAYRMQADDVLAAVQVLRERAQAGPPAPQVHYVPVPQAQVYYAPPPVFYVPQPVIVRKVIVADHSRRHDHDRDRHRGPHHGRDHDRDHDRHAGPGRDRDRDRGERQRNGPPSPAARMQQEQSNAYRARARANNTPHRVPESQRQPIVRSR